MDNQKGKIDMSIFRTLEKSLMESIPALVGKRVWLHIGTPKTGTSSLQRYLFENRSALLSQGILYPEDTVLYRHQPWFQAIYTNDWPCFTEYLTLESLAAAHTLVLSTEGFYNLSSDLNEAAFAALRALAQVTDLRVVVYLRSRADYFDSYYRQAVVNPNVLDNYYGTSQTAEEILQHPRMRANLDYEKTLLQWLNVVAEDRLFVRPYQGDTIADFMALLEIKTDGFVCVENQNKSLPAVAVEVIRRCNAFMDTETQQRLVAVLRETGQLSNLWMQI